MDKDRLDKAWRAAWLALPFLSACLLAFLIEHGVERLIGNEGAQSVLAEPFFNMSGLYQRLVTAGPRKPVQKFTVLVDDDANKDPYYSRLSGGVIDLCQRRHALAALIAKIAAADPAVIVLDKAFRPKQCPAGDPGTRELLAAVAAASARLPVVVGRRIDRAAMHLYPALAFARDATHLQDEGVIEFDPDTKKLPLRWAVHPDADAPDRSEAWTWVPTLSLVAAQAYDDRLQSKYPRLRDLLSGPPALPQEATHPYVSFLRPGQLTVYAAGELLCGPDYARVDARCRDDPLTLRRLRGKIVLVGENSEDDRHLSVVGDVPGFVLHANYIEALLDQRYFNPAPWLDYVLGFLIFSAILFGLHFDDVFKTLACWAATLGVAYLIVYFIIMHMGYYVNPVAVSVLALLFNVTHLLFGKLKHGVHAVLERVRASAGRSSS